MKKSLILLAILLANNSLYADYTVIIGVRDIKFIESAVTEPEVPEIPIEPEPEPEPVYSSCKDHLNKDNSAGNGVYTIQSNGSDLPVYCDMTNGGWTLVAVGVRGQVGNWKTQDDYNLNTAPAPSPTTTYKLADSRINSINKSVFRVVTTGTYSNTRYFNGSCQYMQNTQAVGSCLVSYSNEALSQGMLAGAKTDIGGGLSDYDGNHIYVITSFSGSNAAQVAQGWSMGMGGSPSNTGTGSAGNGGNLQIWVK